MLIIDPVIAGFTNQDYTKLKRLCSFYNYSNNDLIQGKWKVIGKHMVEETSIINKYLQHRKQRFYDMQLTDNPTPVQDIIDKYNITHIDLMYPSNMKLKGIKHRNKNKLLEYFLGEVSKNVLDHRKKQSCHNHE